MKLTFLGTAAAEAQPALFCTCDTCKKARANGGKDIRKRCGYWLDDDTLIDYGPDIFAQSVMYGIDLAKIRRIFFTHSHSDHLAPMELYWRNPGYSKVDSDLDIFGDKAVHERIKQTLCYEDARLIEHQVFPGDIVRTGDMEVLALRADHDPQSTPLNYIITRNGKTILIGNDSGYWSDESWTLAEQYGHRMDLIILECTFGLGADACHCHLSAAHTVRFRDMFIERGLIDSNTRCVTTHFSHNARPIHEDMEKYFLPHGIEVAYDGMRVEI